jgi:hypothetical protein
VGAALGCRVSISTSARARVVLHVSLSLWHGCCNRNLHAAVIVSASLLVCMPPPSLHPRVQLTLLNVEHILLLMALAIFP